MAMKTVLKQLMKILPKSVEIQRAIQADETVKTKISSDMFQVKDEMIWESEEKKESDEKIGSESEEENV